jgi:large conductance mechanosensitive channel
MTVRRLWAEFKAIAIGGSVLDLALGFIIGTAFATLIQSFVTNLFLQAVAAAVGQPDFKNLAINVHHTPIRYGMFLNDVLQFVLLALGLFIVIKFMTLIGVERGRSLELRNCPYCLDRIPSAALTCRSCGQQLVADLPDPQEAERLQLEREARKWPTLPPITIPRRRATAGGGPDEHSAPSATADEPEHPAAGRG